MNFTKYFGRRAWGDAVFDHRLRMPTPVGEECLHCGEPIAEGDAGIVMPCIELGEDGHARAPKRAQHRECFLRTMVGSVAHQEGRCSCFGGKDEDEDPPGMSKREAARAACQHAGVREL
jgi:hypothetical protein